MNNVKQIISVLLAAGALAGAGAAHAQAECQRTDTCSSPLAPYQGGDAQGRYDPWVAEQYGLVPPGTAYAANGGYVYNGGYAYNGWGYPQYVAPYPRTSHDRDGDGVRNNRDRYPDDPRYR